MPNYAETTAPGETRRRAHRLIIRSVEGEPPEVLINTQDRINLADGSREFVERGAIAARFDAVGQAFEFPLVDIDTGQSLGRTMTGAELMVAVQSWVLAQMMAADAAPPEA